MHRSLKEIQTNLGKEIGITTKDINSILKQIAGLNDQIAKVEPNGYMPNDLYDARDLLLDELSAIVPIETEYVPSGGRALAIAEGTVTVKLKLEGETVTIVNGRDFAELQTDPQELVEVDVNGTIINHPVEGIKVSALSTNPDGTAAGAATHNFDKFSDIGKLKSLVNSYGTTDGKGLYPEMLTKLDTMANNFMAEFNRIHQLGFTLATDGDPSVGGGLFFEDATAGAGGIKVLQAIIDDPSLIAASIATGEEGQGANALALSNMQFTALISGATLQTYFQGVIGELGVDGEQAQKFAYNTATLLGAVEHRRASIISVSLDEEMTDMIRFQQAYNASARMITVVDETLDKIINGMGIVGR